MNQMLDQILYWAAQAETGAAPGGKPSSPLGSFLFPLVAIMILFFFMVLRPQRAEQRRREAQLSAVGKGDTVVTIGGMHGTVESVDPAKGIVTVAVAPKVSIKFNKSAIASVVPRKQREGEKEKETEEKSGA